MLLPLPAHLTPSSWQLVCPCSLFGPRLDTFRLSTRNLVDRKALMTEWCQTGTWNSTTTRNLYYTTSIVPTTTPRLVLHFRYHYYDNKGILHGQDGPATGLHRLLLGKYYVMADLSRQRGSYITLLADSVTARRSVGNTHLI